jgi:hypothetical protein
VRWDVVTLNQASEQAWRRDTFEPALGLLLDTLRAAVPGARVFLHQTWAYRADAPYLPLNAMTEDIMFERLRGNYRDLAAALGCGLLPCGEAVQRARRAPGRTFRWPDPAFDYQHAAAPALPRQEHSLSVGWTWVINDTPDGVPQLALDYNHLNPAGCYLLGCVWFERITGIDCRRVSFRPGETSAGDAAFLRETAHETCAGG